MFLETLIHSFVALFVIIDPVGMAPLFIGIISPCEPAEARRIAIRSCVVAAGIMAFFALLGEPLLKQLGISVAAFRIAGGALLFVTAFNMLMNTQEPRRRKAIADESFDNRDVAVFPIAIPLLAGPGCITTIILLMSQTKGGMVAQSATIVALVLVNVVTVICMLGAEKISHSLGKTGTNVFMRVLGLILAALSVQYIADGIKTMFLK